MSNIKDSKENADKNVGINQDRTQDVNQVAKENESTKKKYGIKGKALAITCLLIITAINFLIFPWLGERAEKYEENVEKENKQYKVNNFAIETLYNGSKILFLELLESENQSVQVQIESDSSLDSSSVFEINDSTYRESNGFQNMNYSFDTVRNRIDYCVFEKDENNEYQLTSKNTNNELERLLDQTSNQTEKDLITSQYDHYFILSYNEWGNVVLDTVASNSYSEDDIVKAFQLAERETEEEITIYSIRKEEEDLGNFKGPRDISIIYGISDENYSIGYDNYDYFRSMAYRMTGTVELAVLSLIVIALLSFIIGWREVVGKEKEEKRRSKWALLRHPLGFAIIAIFSIINFAFWIFLYIVHDFNRVMNAESFSYFYFQGLLAKNLYVLVQGFVLFLVYGIWYFSVSVFRSIFCKGLGDFIKDKSLLYQTIPWGKRKWNNGIQEIYRIDMNEKANKWIVKVVIINFLILGLIACTWMFGIILLIGYSFGVFYLMRRYYSQTQENYQTLLEATQKIAGGNMEGVLEDNVGPFESLKVEINKMQIGLKVAVSEEVKAQRMKTDLITNVSHDLKTPLTAITTYIELLKDDSITTEERHSYIDTLEKKSRRLKILIEDLFEISKATSENITLNLVDVDIVNLVRQVSVEVKDKFDETGLSIKWKLPEDKIILPLDSQKTYRIFENLFVNISKYAMSNTRVYVEIMKVHEVVTIILRNISETEIDFTPEEISERFVRGDLARNTEGSGLGLAIAKSFVEAQAGSFTISAEGDLFKVTITW